MLEHEASCEACKASNLRKKMDGLSEGGKLLLWNGESDHGYKLVGACVRSLKKESCNCELKQRRKGQRENNECSCILAHRNRNFDTFRRGKVGGKRLVRTR